MAPPILSTSHCEFNGTHSCAHARKTILLAPIHPFTKQTVATFIVSIIVYPKLMQIVPSIFGMGIIKDFIPSITFLHMRRFFLFLSLFHCHRMLFCGLAGGCVNHRSFLFVHSLVCPITHSFLDRFQPNLVQHSPTSMPLPVILFSAWRKHLNVFVKGSYTAGWFLP